MIYKRHMTHDTFFFGIPDLSSAHCDLSGVTFERSREQSGNGTLTTSRFSYNRDEPTARNGKCHAAQDLSRIIIGKMHIFKADLSAAFRDLFFLFFSFRQVEQRFHLVTRSHSVHCHMEK